MLMARRCRSQFAVLAWLLALWALAVAVPAASLWPEHGLNRPVLWLLLVAAPVGALVAATSGKAWTTLCTGLVGCVPPLVACPALARPPADQPWSGLWVALAALAAIDAALAHDPQAVPLRRLLKWPQRGRDQILAVLGVAWLALAWFGPAATATTGSLASGRALRVGGAAVCWSLVAGASAGRTDHPNAAGGLLGLTLRRGGWLALIGGLLWAWQSR